jgi:hypothetical protein
MVTNFEPQSGLLRRGCWAANAALLSPREGWVSIWPSVSRGRVVVSGPKLIEDMIVPSKKKEKRKIKDMIVFVSYSLK